MIKFGKCNFGNLKLSSLEGIKNDNWMVPLGHCRLALSSANFLNHLSDVIFVTKFEKTLQDFVKIEFDVYLIRSTIELNICKV